ncbi:MAG: hypothetical protein RR313_11010 [Anaerovoracaceae bacterium]
MIATSERNMAVEGQASQRDLFRLSAILYAEMTDTFSSQEVLRGIVECVIAENSNYQVSIEDLQSKILENFKLNITEDELLSIFARSRESFIKIANGTQVYYQLTSERFEATNRCNNTNIDFFIEQFVQEKAIEKVEDFYKAIYRYLYELTTTNINSYKLLFSAIDSGKGFKEIDLSVEGNLFTNEQLQYIHSFIEWDNVKKNASLSNLVYCCLEYCLLVAGDKDNSLISNYIRNRVVYLDTNIIFRALGINGKSRETVVMAFLRKCRQAKLKIVISTYTKREFFDTVDYYIGQINEFPRGDIYLGAYEGLSDYNLYAFYNEWLQDHRALSLRYFRNTIQSSYDLLVKNFDIKNGIGDAVNVFTDHALQIRHAYENGIAAVKNDLKDEYIDTDKPVPQYSHDATLIYIVESKRQENVSQDKDSDSFLVSSDKALRYWDMQRIKHSYPVVIYPSQLFLMLIKTCGRSENDMNSFVSFINIRNRSKQISPEKANIILSGISSITADVESQKVIVSSVFDNDFQTIVNNSNMDKELYEKVKLYSQRYLESNLSESERARVAAEKERDTAMNKVSKIVQTVEQTITKFDDQKERICQFAENKTKAKFLLLFYIVPTLIAVLSMVYIVFLILQFVACSASWNFVSGFFNYIQSTTFGEGSGGPLYLIDFVLFGTLSFAAKKAMKNPFNKDKKRIYRNRLVEEYIKNNNLQ